MSIEQEARDLLERMGVDQAQSMTAGDVVELANVLRENYRLQRKQGETIKSILESHHIHNDNLELALLRYFEKIRNDIIEANKRRWRDIESDPPEEGEYIWIYEPDHGFITKRQRCVRYDPNDYLFQKKLVTYWQPLPNPPK